MAGLQCMAKQHNTDIKNNVIEDRRADARTMQVTALFINTVISCGSSP